VDPQVDAGHGDLHRAASEALNGEVQLLVAATVELQDNPNAAGFAELVLRFFG
jgi:hypothetical protein